MFFSKIKNRFQSYFKNYKHQSSRITLLDYYDDSPTISLEEKHLRNAKVFVDRGALLKYFMPKKAICAEVGIAEGDFSDFIYKQKNPRELHLIELSNQFVNTCQKRFKKQIASKEIFIHQGFSYEVIETFPDNYFDWVYIDGDHSYETVKKDLLASDIKIKNDGFIMLDDYIHFSYQEMLQYGVVKAVNEFCNEHNYEILGISISGSQKIKDSISGGKIRANEYSNAILKRL